VKKTQLNPNTSEHVTISAKVHRSLLCQLLLLH